MRRKTSHLRQYESFVAAHFCISCQNHSQYFYTDWFMNNSCTSSWTRFFIFFYMSIHFLTIGVQLLHYQPIKLSVLGYKQRVWYIIDIHIGMSDSAYRLVTNSQTIKTIEITKACQYDKSRCFIFYAWIRKILLHCRWSISVFILMMRCLMD